MTYLWQSHLSGAYEHQDPVYHQKARVEILPFITWTPQRVLDIGCGGGATGRLLQERFPECALYGVEMNAAAADFAGQSYHHVARGSIEAADFDTTGIPFAEIDTVLLLDVLEHLYNPWAVLEKLRALLPNDCRIVASIPNAFNIQLLEMLAAGEWQYDKWGLLDITHIRFFTEREMRDLFVQTGFSVLEIGNVPHPESMLPTRIQQYGDRMESDHVIVKQLDDASRQDLLSIQKILVAAPALAGSTTQAEQETPPLRKGRPVLNSALGKPYLDLVRNCILGLVYDDPAMVPKQGTAGAFSAEVRENGLDWPSTAHSMIGNKRMSNVQALAEHALARGIPGDFIETGVWRGGTCIMMRAVLKAYDVTDRTVWVADSFAGLPPPDPKLYPADQGDTHFTFAELAISLEQVKQNFSRYGLLDEQVRFLKGWFKDTLPAAPIQQLAVLRLDGDMYESTIDALRSLFPKLAPGGFVIIDDYGYIESCRRAVHDYRNAHGITDTIYDIDGIGVFWQNLQPNSFSPTGCTNADVVLQHRAEPTAIDPALLHSAPPQVEETRPEQRVQESPTTHVRLEEQEPPPPPVDPLQEHRALVQEAAQRSSSGDLAGAADILIPLVEAGTDVWEAYNDLAAIALHQGEAETAEELLLQALEKTSQPGQANINLAVLQVINGQLETALATLSPLLRHDPGNFAALELVREILCKITSISPIAWARLTGDLRHQPKDQ